MARITLKYRLFPTKAHEMALTETLAVCREVYNSLAHERTVLYEQGKKSPNYHSQAVAIARWKKDHPELKKVHSQVLQNVAVRVDLAYQAFFRRVKAREKPGYPRLKGIGQYDSITYPQSGFKVEGSSIWLSLNGRPIQVKAVIHRPVLPSVKTCTIRRQAGKWFACFSCEYEATPLPSSALAVGIDVGLEKFAALSDGTFVANPRFFRTDEKALAKGGRRQAQTPKRSPERRKANKVLSRIHERVRNRRHNFVHQTARQIVNKFGLIVVEDLNIEGMVRNGHLAKSISDAAWGMFLSVTQSKAASAAREYMKRNPAFTSQDCYMCGHRVKKKLSERWHNCPNCTARLDRDTNSSLNLVFAGLKNCVGQYTVAGIPA